MFLTREQIQAQASGPDLPREEVDVPEWGGKVLVRTLSGQERDDWEATIISGKGKRNLKNIRARLAVLCLVDERGRPLLTEEDVGWLGEKSCAVLDRIWETASRLNHLRKEDVEELEKNSGDDPDGSSPSGSA